MGEKSFARAGEPRHNEQLDPSEAGAERDPIDEEIRIIDDEDEPAFGIGTEEDSDTLGEAERCAGRGATRRHWLMHRIAEGFRSFNALRSGPAYPWPKERVAESVWRDLGDKALGLAPADAPPKPLSPLEKIIEEELAEERLILSYPEPERAGLRRTLDSFHLMEDFMSNFEVERDLWLDAQRVQWEAAYWRRAGDESFGKKPWTGPSGREGAIR